MLVAEVDWVCVLPCDALLLGVRDGVATCDKVADVDALLVADALDACDGDTDDDAVSEGVTDALAVGACERVCDDEAVDEGVAAAVPVPERVPSCDGVALGLRVASCDADGVATLDAVEVGEGLALGELDPLCVAVLPGLAEPVPDAVARPDGVPDGERVDAELGLSVLVPDVDADWVGLLVACWLADCDGVPVSLADAVGVGVALGEQPVFWAARRAAPKPGMAVHGAPSQPAASNMRTPMAVPGTGTCLTVPSSTSFHTTADPPAAATMIAYVRA